MDGCVGREKNLAYLEDIWSKVPVSCAICGRRHLGKTTMLRQFTSDKKHIYITGTAGLRSDNLEEINRALSSFSGKDERITDLVDLFPRIKSICGKQKVVVIIDRLSDLEGNFPEVSAYIRSFMSRELGTTRIMLVVCDNDNSVFGRFYYTLELKPMSYLECKGFHPEYTAHQHLMAYALVGGTPAYQQLFKDTPEEIIRNEMFNHMSVFALEAEGMVSSESMDRAGSAKVLAAVASGAESVREISARTGLGQSYCSKLVEDLEHKGFMLKEVSSGLSRRAVYTINSNILKFYHRVVYKYTHMVEFESSDEAYDVAKKDIDLYMEKGFKEICMDYVKKKFEFKYIGKLRRKDDSVDTIVDFVSSVSEKNRDRMMMARCRLYGAPMGVEEFRELEERGKKVDGPSNKLYMMFSGCDFTLELRDLEKSNPNIKLITLDEVYEM